MNKRRCLETILLGVAMAGMLLATSQRQSAAAELPPAGEELPRREIFVPFADLHVILLSDVQRVFMTRGEYEALAAKAKQASRAKELEQPAAVLSADYTATFEETRACASSVHSSSWRHPLRQRSGARFVGRGAGAGDARR